MTDIQLKPFDFLLEKGKFKITHLAIMARSRSIYVHAAIVTNSDGSLIEATEKGIVRSNIYEKYKGENITIVRDSRIVESDYEKLMSWLKEKESTSKGYDWLALLGFAFGIKKLQDDDRWYCSELPYWMEQENGYKLTKEDQTFFFPVEFKEKLKNVVFDGYVYGK